MTEGERREFLLGSGRSQRHSNTALLGHRGPTLSEEDIGDLRQGDRVCVTWCKKNGPWIYEVVIDDRGRPCANNHDRTPLIQTSTFGPHHVSRLP